MAPTTMLRYFMLQWGEKEGRLMKIKVYPVYIGPINMHRVYAIPCTLLFILDTIVFQCFSGINFFHIFNGCLCSFHHL